MKTLSREWFFKVKAVLFIFTAITGASCGSALVLRSSAEVREAIFSAQDAEQAANAYPMIVIQGPYWTPTDKETKAVRAVLITYLQSQQSDSAMQVVRHLDEYRLQYLGYSDHGAHFIFVNGFCESDWKDEKAWTSRIVFVFDGGSCFFQARYRSADSKITEFEINGEA